MRKILIRFHFTPLYPVITVQMPVTTMTVSMLKEQPPEKLTISVLKFPVD